MPNNDPLYWSESKKRSIPLSQMRPAHIVNAIGKLRKLVESDEADQHDRETLTRLEDYAENNRITAANTPHRGEETK